MHPEQGLPAAPDTPNYWRELEELLDDTAVRGVQVADVPSTPQFEATLDRRLSEVTSSFAKREHFPVAAVAAAGLLMVALAGFLTLRPGDELPTTAATPGIETTTIVAMEVSAEQMVVASFQRWVDGRTEAERLTNRLTNEGYDVVVRRLNVAEPTQNGQVLEIRHGIGSTGTTVVQPRGQVVLVIGRTVAAGENVSG